MKISRIYLSLMVALLIGLGLGLPLKTQAEGGEADPAQETPEEEEPCECPRSGPAPGLAGMLGCTYGCNAECKPILLCPDSAISAEGGATSPKPGDTFEVVKDKNGDMQLKPGLKPGMTDGANTQKKSK